MNMDHSLTWQHKVQVGKGGPGGVSPSFGSEGKKKRPKEGGGGEKVERKCFPTYLTAVGRERKKLPPLFYFMPR